MKWEFKDGIPTYQQIVQLLRVGIANETWPPGSKVPAVRDLAFEAGVNPNTMQRALTELEREGLMYSVRTSGRFITDDEAKLKAVKETLSRDYIEEMIRQLKGLGYEKDEIIRMVHEVLTGKASEGQA